MTDITNHKSITERLSALQNKKLQSWEKNFYNSFKDKTALTKRQLATLTKIEDRLYKVEQQREAWLKEWCVEKQSKFNLACKFYRFNYGSWNFFKKHRQTIRLHIKEESFVPSKKEYYRIAENKYVNKAIVSYYDAPKYHVGDLVYVVGQYNRKFPPSLHWIGVVVKPAVKEFVKKQKKYEIKPINIKNYHENRIIPERFVLSYRKK